MSEMITRTPDMIAGEINTIKEQVRSTAVMASVEIGRRLKEAKGLVPEGQWTEWLQGRVSYSLRTAQNLMALASEWDAGHGAALEGMSYTKAVLLLGVPRYDREEFVATHDVDAMSTRELKQVIADLEDRLTGKQMDMEDMIAEQDAEAARQLKTENDQLKAQLLEAKKSWQAAVDDGKARIKEEKKLRDQLAEAKAASGRETKEAAEKIKALEEKLAAAADREPEIREVVPKALEDELKKLRALAGRSQTETDVRSAYDLLKAAFDTLRARLDTMESEDAQTAQVYRGAFAKGLKMMAEMIQGGR